MRQIQTQSDASSKKNIVNRISDIPGGISLTVADLVAGKIVEEGTPVSAPSSGKRTLCKAAKLVPGTSTTVFTIPTALNPFKVGEFLTLGEGMAAAAIQTIVASGANDVVTLVGAINDPTGVEWIYQAAAAATGAGTYDTDATLNIAYDNDTCVGLTADAESVTNPAPAGSQGTLATVVGTITTTGDAEVTVSSDLLAVDVVVTVAVAENDTATIVASKIRQALATDADIAPLFTVSGEGTQVILTRSGLAYTVDGSVFLNQPDAILKNAFVVPTDPMVILMQDAFVRADVIAGSLPPAYIAKLPLIGEIKY
jgi:hypothetical protein